MSLEARVEFSTTTLADAFQVLNSIRVFCVALYIILLIYIHYHVSSAYVIFFPQIFHSQSIGSTIHKQIFYHKRIHNTSKINILFLIIIRYRIRLINFVIQLPFRFKTILLHCLPDRNEPEVSQGIKIQKNTLVQAREVNIIATKSFHHSADFT